MSLVFIPQLGGSLQLEDGLGNLLMENNDTVTLESLQKRYLRLEDGLGNLLMENDDTFTLESFVAELAVQVIDENPTLAIPYYWLQPNYAFQLDPGTLFESPWWPAIGQQMQEVLMPVYDERVISGDIPNQPYVAFQLFANVHFGPDADDVFASPTSVDIVEGPADVDLRTE